MPMRPDPVALFADAGARGWLHAVRVGDPSQEVALDADQQVPIASVYKLPLAVAWARLVQEGRLDPGSRVRLPPTDRTPGPTGISQWVDEVVLSQRDLVRQMLVVSDNCAADALLALVGLDAVNDTMAELGLGATVLRHGTRQSQLIVEHDTGTRSFATSMRALTDLDRDVVTDEYDPALASSSTARDMTRLLDAVWSDRAGLGPAGDLVREAMAQQVWRHRLASGFPHDDVVVAGKTGTLGTLRHEVGVVTFPGEVPVAVAVFTRSARTERQLPAVDGVVGAVARAAVHPLRRPVASLSEGPGGPVRSGVR